MKYLLCLLALSMPCSSFAAVAFASEARQQAQVEGRQGAQARHHPLIDVKFVLRNAPAKQDELPPIQFGENRSVIRPMSPWGSHVLSLNPGYVNPNVYVCGGWACWDGLCM
jgi:hypothetical protein